MSEWAGAWSSGEPMAPSSQVEVRVGGVSDPGLLAAGVKPRSVVVSALVGTAWEWPGMR